VGSKIQALFQASLPSRFLAPQDRPSITVLPFAAANPDDEYLVEGICDDIITGPVQDALALRHRT
jgi:TolB-like protein